jgi:hypothetical protein
MNTEIFPHEDKAMKKSGDEYFGTHTVPQSVAPISNEARHPRVREQIAYLLYEYFGTEAQILHGRYQVVTEHGDHETSHGES